MAVSRVRVEVHEKGIQSLFLPAGDVNKFGRQRVSADITREMREFALRNMRTGTLLKSFRSTSQVRRNAVRFTNYSTAPHALHLERGTRPQSGVILYEDVGVQGPGGRLIAGGIVGGRGRAAANPRWHAWIGVPMRQVAGIRPRRFMSKALRSALRNNGLV
jgi:hypothetical protein